MDTSETQAQPVSHIHDAPPVDAEVVAVVNEPTPEPDRTQEGVSAVLASLVPIVRTEAEAIKAAPREVQLVLGGAATFVVSSVFEWWSGFARVSGVVRYSASGSGNAFSDWRGSVGVACALAVMTTCVYQIARRSTISLQHARVAHKISAVHSIGALLCTLWLWAAFSASADLSDGLTISFGASFGLYLAIAASATASIASLRQLRIRTVRFVRSE